MDTKKQLYPLKFIPIASKKVWGGDLLIKKLNKTFTECNDDGDEIVLGAGDKVGESWEIADMGFADSVVACGWLGGNTMEELMETYIERVVGEDVYQCYGRQFPLLVKFLGIKGRTSVQVHPDDVAASQRYDSLGKGELWYVLEASEDAKVYLGLKRELSAQELYDRCLTGTIEEELNVIKPRKGDAFYIKPGTIHSAEGNLLIAEVGESSDITFRLYDWGRENSPETARPMHLEEAIDLIDFGKADDSMYIPGPIGKDTSHCGCGHDHGSGHNHGNDNGECCHDHGSQDGCHEEEIVRKLVQTPQFTVNELKVHDPLHIYTEKFGRFIIYMCVGGKVSVQVPLKDEKGAERMDRWELKMGETILIPADMPDFFLVPEDRDAVLLEAMVEHSDEYDDYINQDTDPYLEGEDYEGVEDDDDCCCGHHDHGNGCLCDHDNDDCCGHDGGDCHCNEHKCHHS